MPLLNAPGQLDPVDEVRLSGQPTLWPTSAEPWL